MAVTIDERVVEMRFNNKQFEEGVKQSLNSLEKMDSAIDNLDGKSLDGLQKSMKDLDMSKIESSLQSLEKRFSTMGIVGMTVIQDLTRGVEGLFKSFMNLLNKPLAQIKSGGWARAMNIEDAKFQLQGLKVAWEDISEDINYAVSGTAYGLDAAAKAASQLAATGVEFGEAYGDTGNSPMAKALRGISGVAAMANASYEEISPIFTTIAGQGKVMTMQLRQLEARGLNAAAELGKALGTTEQEVREMVTAGVISFDMFAEAMDDAFGQHAKDANKTFSGSLSNMKAALSRIGADMATNVLQDMVGVFNDLRVVIDKLHVALKPTIEEINKWIHIGTLAMRVAIKWASESKTLQNVFSGMQKTFVALSKYVATLVNYAVKNSGPLITAIKNFGTALGNILRTIFRLNQNISPLQVVLNSITMILSIAVNSITALLNLISSILNTLSRSKVFNKIMEVIQPMAKVLIPALVAGLILSKLHLLKVALAVGAVGAAIAVIRKYDIINKLKKLPQLIVDVGNSIKTNVGNALQTAGDTLKKLIPHSDETGDSLNETGENAEAAGKRVWTFGSIVKTVTGVMKKFLTQLEPAKIMLFTLGISFAYAMVNISKGIRNFGKVIEKFSPFTWLNSLTKAVRTYLEETGRAEKIKQSIKYILAITGSLIALGTATAIISKYVDPKNFLMIAAGITAMTSAIALLYVAISKYTAVKQAFNPLESALGTLNTTASTVSLGLQNLLNNIGKTARLVAVASVLGTLTTTIAALTGSIILLHKKVPVSSLEQIVKAMGMYAAIAAGLVAVVSIFSKLSGAARLTTGLVSLSAVFIAISSSMFIMAKAIQAFQGIKWDKMNLVGTITAMAASAAVLIGVAWAASKVLDRFTDSLWSLIASAVSLGLIFISLPRIIKAFGKALNDIGTAFDGFKMMLIPQVIRSLGLILVAVVAVSRFAKKAASAVAIMVGSVGALVLLMSYMKKIGGDAQALENIKTAFKNLAGVIVSFGAVVAGLLVAAGQAKYALRSAAFLLAMPAMILAFAGSFKVLSMAVASMDMQTLTKTMIAFVGMLVSLGVALKLASDFQAGWKSLLALSSVITALTVAIGLLGWLAEKNPVGILVGATAMMLALIGLSRVMQSAAKEMKKIKLGNLVKLILGMATTLAAVTTALTVVARSGADWSAIAASAGALSVTIYALSKVFSILTKAGTSWDARKWSKMKKSLGVMTALSADLIVIGAALRLVAGAQDWDAILASAVALSAVIGVIGGVLALLSTVSGNISTEKILAFSAAVGVMSLSLLPMAVALNSLAKYDWNIISASVFSLGGIMLELGVILGALSVLSKAVAPTTILAISAAMLVMSVGVAAIALAFSTLADVPWQTIVAAAAAIGGLTAVLAIIAGVLGNVPPAAILAIGVLAALSVTMLSFGAAALMVGASVGIIVGSIALLTATVTKFLSFVAQNGAKARDGLIEVGNGAMVMASLIGKGLQNAMTSVGLGMQSIAQSSRLGIVAIATAIGMGIKSIATSIGEGLISITKSIDVALGNIITTIGKRGKQLIATVYRLILDLAVTVRKGIGELKAIIMGGNGFSSIGEWIPRSLGVGIGAKSGNLFATVRNLGAGIEETLRNRLGIHSYSAIFGGIGEWIPISEAIGIKNKESVATDAVSDMGDTIVDTLSDKCKEAGKDGGSSLASGLGNFIDNHKDTFKKIGSTAAGWVSNTFVGDIMNTVSGISSMLGGASSAFDTAAARIQAERDLQARYEHDAAFRKQVDASMGYLSGTREAARSIKETAVWQRALVEQINKQKTAYEEAADPLNKLKKTLEGILNLPKNDGDSLPDPGEVADVTDAITDLNDAVGGSSGGSGGTTKLIDDLASSVKSATEIFGDFDRSVNITAKDLLTNVNNQIKGVKEWAKGVQVLAARGFDKSVIEQILEMGPEESYQYVSALLTMTKKQMDTYSDKIRRAAKLPDKTVADLKNLYNKDGTEIAESFVDGMTSDQAWKDFNIGIQEKVELTGKKLEKEVKKHMLSTLDLSKMSKLKGMEDFADAMSDYVDSTSKSAKKARQEFKEYVTMLYLETLDEEEKQKALTMETADLNKKVAAWWKERQKDVEASIRSEIHSMEDLASAYDQTFDELIDSMQKKTDDYKKLESTRMYLAGIAYQNGWNIAGEYLMNEASSSEILALAQGLGEKSAEEVLKTFSKTLKSTSTVKMLESARTQLEAAIATGDDEAAGNIAASLEKYIVKIKSFAEIYNEAVKGIQEGAANLWSSSKAFTRISQKITSVFGGMSSVLKTTTLNVGRKALEKYAMSLIDFDEVLEEAKITGVDAADIVTAKIEEASQAILSLRDNIESSLKSALKSFSKFDSGEETSMEKLQENLRNNITKLNEWRANIRKMQAMGYSQEVIQAMTEQGISSYANVAALTAANVVSSDVDQINNMWYQIGQQTSDAADEALGAIAISAETVGTDTIDLMTDVMEEEMEYQKPAVVDAATGLGDAVIQGLEESKIEEAATDAATKAATVLSNTLDNHTNRLQVREAARNLGKMIGHGVRLAIKDDRADTSESSTISKARSFGRAIVNGLVKGIRDNQSKVTDAMTSLARSAMQAAKDELDINSPSKEMAWIGEMAVRGLSAGISDSEWYATDAMGNLTESLMQYTAALADDLANSTSFDEDWIIKPVLDLDNLQNASSQIQSLLNNGDIAVRSGMLASQTSPASEWGMLTKALSGLSGGNTTTTYGDATIVVNPPAGSNSREIAEMVMTEIQRRVDRRQRT